MDIKSIISEVEQDHKLSNSAYRNYAARHNISYTAMWVLYIVSDSEDAVTQQELCRAGGYSKQTIHTAVNSLITAGYAELEAIPGTRNHKKILLTDAGKKFASDIIGMLRTAEINAYRVLSPEELGLYAKLTSRISDALCKEINEI